MAYDFEAFQKFGKEQFDAASAAMSEVAKGLQAIATEAGDYSKKSFEDSSALVEKLVGVKKIDEAISLQTEYAKTSYEGFVAQATKMGEMYQAVAKEAFKPVEGAIAKMQAAAK
ncbi:MAG: phasin family protein [Rhodoblastus sp.]|nr:phasin family protein [Rhodoblastus sp.]